MAKNSGRIVCQMIDNFPHDPLFKREDIEFTLNYKPGNCEKLLVTYPKCGTTWTQQIMCLIINDGILQNNDREFILNLFLEY
jgi:hypothetical protein